jgi:hypothetical protein
MLTTKGAVSLHFQRVMVRPGGFEPPTLCFGGTRSIHLSYGRILQANRR